jgi:hypothetical protein
MKLFFKRHTEGFLTTFAILLVGITAWCFIWGMAFLVQNLNDIFAAPAIGAQTVSFNLSGAQSLSLKGLSSP